jgi:hypothetical protein
MKRIWTIFLFAGIVQGADVTAWISEDGVVVNTVRWSATHQAVKMFDAIGVSLEWAKIPPAADQGVTIEVRFITHFDGIKPGVLAFSTPFDPKPVVTVLYDQIVVMTTAEPRYRAMLLAHVLVHEISHVLMRASMHSHEGVMKAYWTLQDHRQMAMKRALSFLPGDVQAIRAGLASFGGRRVQQVESDPAPGRNAHGDSDEKRRSHRRTREVNVW